MWPITACYGGGERGKYEAALAWYQRLDDYASSSEDTFWLPRIPICMGGVYLELFDSEEALRLNLEADEAAKQWYPWPEPRGHSLVQAGLACLYLDQHGQAKAYFRAAEALLNDDAWMRWRWQMVLLRAFGELALTEQRYDDAWTYARQSLELARQSDSRKHVARAQLLQGKILLARGQWEDAVQALTTTVGLADHIQTPRDAWIGRAELAKALLQSRRDKEAETHYSQAIQIVESLAATLQQPHVRQRFLQAPPVMEIYTALGHRPPADTSYATHCRAAPSCDRVRQAADGR